MKIVILIIIFNCFNIYSEDGKKVLVIPFLNEGKDESIEYISEVIPNSFNQNLDSVPEYTAVTYDELKAYMKENNLGLGDFYNRDTLMEISEYFNIDNIIRGEYFEDINFNPKILRFKIEFLEIDYKEYNLEVIYRINTFGESGLNTYDTLDMIVDSILKDFLGVVTEYAYLEVITDLPCELYIDDLIMGVTPLEQKRIATGNHNIRIYYNGDNKSGDIFNEDISIAKNEEKEINLIVLKDLIITTELECSLYLDDEFIGVSPYEGKLLTGNEYNLKIMYEYEMFSEVVSDTEIISDNGESISLYFPVTGNINLIVDKPDSPLRVQLNELPEKLLPYQFTEMPLGTYDIKVYVYDEEHDNKYTFVEDNLYLSPDETREIDLNYLDYRSKPGYCLVPGLAQFYNRQPVKGRIVLIAFVTGVLAIGLAPIISNIYVKRIYEPMLNDYGENGEASGYTRQDILDAGNNVDKIFNIMLISGISTCFSAFLYSLIDGAVNMKRLNNIFNPIKMN